MSAILVLFWMLRHEDLHRCFFFWSEDLRRPSSAHLSQLPISARQWATFKIIQGLINSNAFKTGLRNAERMSNCN